MKAKREEAEEKLAKSKRRNTKLKKALVEAEEKLQSAQQTVADVLVSGASTRRLNAHQCSVSPVSSSGSSGRRRCGMPRNSESS